MLVALTSVRRRLSVVLLFGLTQIVVLSTTADQPIAQSSNVFSSEFFSVSSNGTLLITTQLDIMMTLDQFSEHHSYDTREKRKARAEKSSRWDNGIVYYMIKKDVDNQRHIIKAAMDHWRIYTCLQFVESRNADYILLFRFGDWCKSFVGRSFRVQDLYINPTCATLRSIIHEIGHAIGFHHEHMRPDRDRYIKINFDILPPVYKDQFKMVTKDIYLYNIPYDYTSVMHYGLYGSIQALDPSYQEKIGKGNGLSFKDIKLANLMYTCMDRTKCRDKRCPFNGFVFFKTFKGAPKCECWCDSGNVNDPLVRCSSIRKEVPAPKIMAASMLESSDDSDCIDMRDNCTDLKMRDMCRKEIVMMNNMCAKTCDFCGKAEHLCMDHDDGCGMIASTGACQKSGLHQFVRKLCPMSCGLCVTGSSPCQIESSLMEPLMTSVNGASLTNRWITIVVILVATSSCSC